MYWRTRGFGRARVAQSAAGPCFRTGHPCADIRPGDDARRRAWRKFQCRFAPVFDHRPAEHLVSTQCTGGPEGSEGRASLNQRQVRVSELVIHAPISGQVTTRVAELGENFSAGSPLFSIIDLQNPWFTFNLREDLLKGLKVGDGFDVTVPALGGGSIPVKVT